MPRNVRSTSTTPLHRYLSCEFCGARFQISRRGQPGGALGTAARLTGMVNKHEAECPRAPCARVRESGVCGIPRSAHARVPSLIGTVHPNGCTGFIQPERRPL